MKKSFVIVLMVMTSGFAHAKGTASKKVDACNNAGSTMEMLECMGAQVEASQAKIKASIENRKAALKASISEQGLDADTAEAAQATVKALDTVMENLDKAVTAICVAEGSQETVVGSLGRLVTVSCMKEKYEALSKKF